MFHLIGEISFLIVDDYLKSSGTKLTIMSSSRPLIFVGGMPDNLSRCIKTRLDSFADIAVLALNPLGRLNLCELISPVWCIMPESMPSYFSPQFKLGLQEASFSFQGLRLLKSDADQVLVMVIHDPAEICVAVPLIGSAALGSFPLAARISQLQRCHRLNLGLLPPYV